MSPIVRSYQSGPTSFVKESERHFEPSHSQGSDIKAPQSNQLHDSTLNFTQVSGYYTSFQHEEKQQGTVRSTE